MVIDFDHVAIGLHSIEPTLHTLVGEFGAEVLFGGEQLGFRAMQVQCTDMRIELLEPYNVELNDFLVRFLKRSGEGPHHITFKTDDIESALARVEEAGYQPVGVNIANPWWREAFIHPKQAGGVVVQLAQSGFEPSEFEARREEFAEYTGGPWWSEPPPRAAAPATLERVVVTTEAIDRALGLYSDLLGGRTFAHGEGWVELAWSGGRLRLEIAAGRPEGIDRLEWTHGGRAEERVVGGTRFALYPSEP